MVQASDRPHLCTKRSDRSGIASLRPIHHLDGHPDAVGAMDGEPDLRHAPPTEGLEEVEVA
jgi:hypothetical protein